MNLAPNWHSTTSHVANLRLNLVSREEGQHGEEDYPMLVLMALLGISLDDVCAELARRHRP